MFLDLPGPQQREQIWAMNLRKFGLDPDQCRPESREWAGAEIRSCCRLAALLDVPLMDAATNIVPVAVTAGESVEKLRQWASGRCLSADRPGIYSREDNGMPRSGRSVHRGDPNANCYRTRSTDRSRPRGPTGIGPRRSGPIDRIANIVCPRSGRKDISA